MNNQNYINNSLQLHLFFARIMKEHSFFLEAGFVSRDKEYQKMANEFQTAFANVLEMAIDISGGCLAPEILMSHEIVTDQTYEAEQQSSYLSGIPINSQITIKEMNFKANPCPANSGIMSAVESLNKQTLPLIQQLIAFKENIIDNVLSCQMFTANYPLLIMHIRNEARMYFDLLTQIEKREPLSPEYMYQQELFWNNIMKEHAEFIRGLLDPTEKELIMTANEFAQKYEKILDAEKQNISNLTNVSLNQTIEFRNFKMAGEDGILNCKIKSIIIPLLADHVVREANHFIRLLENFKKSSMQK